MVVAYAPSKKLLLPISIPLPGPPLSKVQVLRSRTETKTIFLSVLEKDACRYLAVSVHRPQEPVAKCQCQRVTEWTEYGVW